MDDLISRQAVLEIQAKYAEHMGATKFWQMRDEIRSLPSVEPEIEKCEDCINRKDMIKKLNNLCNNICEYSKKQRKSMCDACNLSFVFDMINNAKSIEPERKTGKWIRGKDGYIRCDKCGSRGSAIKAHYCHHCGAKMEVDG